MRDTNLEAFAATVENRSHRYVVLPTRCGDREAAVRIEFVWNYDGTLQRIDGVLCHGLSGSYLWEQGDRCSVTAENLVPLVRRINLPATA
jgi:hypothetical protein